MFRVISRLMFYFEIEFLEIWTVSRCLSHSFMFHNENRKTKTEKRGTKRKKKKVRGRNSVDLFSSWFDFILILSNGSTSRLEKSNLYEFVSGECCGWIEWNIRGRWIDRNAKWAAHLKVVIKAPVLASLTQLLCLR